MFTTCTKLHVNPTTFSNLTSNDLQITIQIFRNSMFTTCTTPHVYPTTFSIWTSNDLLNCCHSMFNTSTKPHVNPTTLSILTPDDLQMTCIFFAIKHILHVPSLIQILQCLVLWRKLCKLADLISIFRAQNLISSRTHGSPATYPISFSISS